MDNLDEMDKFLAKYDFQKLNQEAIEGLNRAITSKESKTVIRNIPANKSPGPDGFRAEFFCLFVCFVFVNNLPVLKMKKNDTEKNF